MVFAYSFNYFFKDWSKYEVVQALKRFINTRNGYNMVFNVFILFVQAILGKRYTVRP